MLSIGRLQTMVRLLLLLQLIMVCTPSFAINTKKIDVNHPNYLRTVLLSKIVNYIYWPQFQNSDEYNAESINICVLASNQKGIAMVLPYINMLDRRVNAYGTFRVYALVGVDEELDGKQSLQSCQIFYLTKLKSQDLSLALNYARKYQVVTVSGSKHHLGQGVMLGLIERHGKLKIYVNVAAVDNSTIRLKSSLLRIAKKI